jgi:hypothetical protein
MMEKPFHKLAIVISCILIIIITYGIYNTSTKGKGFAIYLTKKDIPPAQMEALSHVDISDQPIISVKDIITYNAQTHEMKLTPRAFDRVYELDVPVTGKSFMVCIDKEPIYWGAFWTPISSLSFDGVTIWKPYNTQEQKIIVLELGYPSPSFYSGEDPRNNRKVLESLEKDGKLITKLTLTAVDKLPHSMKGYELYSWEEGDQWRFTLITGTNRIKTMEEITSDKDFISEIGWVNIHVVGVDAIKDVLIKLPQGESVFWCDELHIGQTMEQINLQLPPKLIVDVIREQADSCGLDFVIAVS